MARSLRRPKPLPRTSASYRRTGGWLGLATPSTNILNRMASTNYRAEPPSPASPQTVDATKARHQISRRARPAGGPQLGASVTPKRATTPRSAPLVYVGRPAAAIMGRPAASLCRSCRANDAMRAATSGPRRTSSISTIPATKFGNYAGGRPAAELSSCRIRSTTCRESMGTPLTELHGAPSPALPS